MTVTVLGVPRTRLGVTIDSPDLDPGERHAATIAAFVQDIVEGLETWQ